MKINNHPAIQEQVTENRYIMIFPEDPPEITPPFVVTTSDGSEVYTIKEFTVPVSREINLQNGNATIIFERPDERDATIQELKAELEALRNAKLETEQKLFQVFAMASVQDFSGIAELASSAAFAATNSEIKPKKKKKEKKE